MTAVVRPLLVVVSALTLAGFAHADDKKDAPVSGQFTGNGKEAKLAYATAFDDPDKKGQIVLVFTEQDHSKAKNPRVKACFGDFGAALVVTVTAEGKVIGCEASHPAFKKGGFSSAGTLKASDFKIADGKVTGTLSTGGESESFGDKWEVKVTFIVGKP